MWTWLALDSESKLIISHYVGQRDAESAWEFIRDLRERTDGIFQLTTDGLRAYVDAVDAHFDWHVHFAQLIKLYSGPDITTGPDWFGAASRVTGTIRSVRSGQPEPRFISTSHVERLNLSVRTHLRRYVRRTNAHSRKLANHKACVTLWVAWYNAGDDDDLHAEFVQAVDQAIGQFAAPEIVIDNRIRDSLGKSVVRPRPSRHRASDVHAERPQQAFQGYPICAKNPRR